MAAANKSTRHRNAENVLLPESDLQVESPLLSSTKTPRFQSHDKGVGTPDHGEKNGHQKRQIFLYALDYSAAIKIKAASPLGLSHGVGTRDDHRYHAKGRRDSKTNPIRETQPDQAERELFIPRRAQKNDALHDERERG